MRRAAAIGTLLLISALLPCVPAQAITSFRTLGPFPLGGSSSERPNAISGDGSTVVGRAQGPPQTRAAFRWTRSEVELIGTTPDESTYRNTTAYGVSADGSVVVGAWGDDPFQWTAESGMVALGNLSEEERSFAWDISADGSVIVGQSGASTAVRWTTSGGIEELGHLDRPGMHSVHDDAAHAVSADGSVIVGQSDFLAFRWTQAGGMERIGGGTVAWGVSADGSTIVGEDAGGRVFRWTESGGFENLGLLSGDKEGWAWDVSGDGSVVVGFGISNGGDQHATIWDEANGIRKLVDVLTSLGLDMSGWELFEASSVSDDGTTIVGTGRFGGSGSETWIAVLTPPGDALSPALGLEPDSGPSLLVQMFASDGFATEDLILTSLERASGGFASPEEVGILQPVLLLTGFGYTWNTLSYSDEIGVGQVAVELELRNVSVSWSHVSGALNSTPLGFGGSTTIQSSGRVGTASGTLAFGSELLDFSIGVQGMGLLSGDVDLSGVNPQDYDRLRIEADSNNTEFVPPATVIGTIGGIEFSLALGADLSEPSLFDSAYRPVPEPSQVVLCAAALVVLAALMGSRQRSGRLA